MRIGSDSLIDASIDLSSPWTSSAIWVGHVNQYSIQLVFDGMPEGTWRLQASADKGNDAATEAYMSVGVQNWTTVEGSSQLIDEAGDHAWNVSESGYRWVRVQWLPSAGTGNLTSARYSTKGF